MAEGARRLLGATYALSTTGVAGPDPQEGQPVGTVFVGVAGPDGASPWLASSSAATGRTIQERTCDEALAALAGDSATGRTGPPVALGP